ncbi:MAG: hypothetical protein OEV94_02255 [Deltaproteobacteria bacterium]|nr:hypothetical protein [Deltaproteobacteria bacterium]
MGKTVAPYSWVIDQQQQAWADFRRALRKEDQAYFDLVFDAARKHTPSGVAQSAVWPMEAILLANLIELHKALARLQAKPEEGPGAPPNAE